MKKAIKKLFPTFITFVPHQINMALSTIQFMAAVIIGIILLLNVVFSQDISPLFFHLTSEDEKSVVQYLKIIRFQTGFNDELTKWKTIYGNSISDLIFSDEISRKQMIQNLEQVLIKNPYSRDVLYSLYLLYNQNGDHNMAEEYLSRAKAIDPVLK